MSITYTPRADASMSTRSLILGGTASTSGALVPIDPWSATAEQVALVLADIRSWDADHGDDDMSDAAILARYRGSVCLPGHWTPGALEFSPYGDDDALDAAWVAVLTPRA